MTDSRAGGPTGRRRGRRGGADVMVPDADFTSYYGRPVVKPSPWTADIPGYLFLGGLAGGSSLLAAGADLTGNAALRRPTRVTAAVAIIAGLAALIHDLGRPARFHHMLRVAKLTSPMSVGTWILAGYGPAAILAAAAEARAAPSGTPVGRLLRRALPVVGRGAGAVAALLGPAVASYTAVLLADTATPGWHEAHRAMPFVFVGSAAAAAGGLAMITTDTVQARPARRMALAGAAIDLATSKHMESAMGSSAETMHHGRAGTYTAAARALTAAGACIAATLAPRSRTASAVSGAALLAGSVCTRFGIFHAGQQSARDPRYTIEPQRRRRDRGTPGG